MNYFDDFFSNLSTLFETIQEIPACIRVMYNLLPAPIYTCLGLSFCIVVIGTLVKFIRSMM